MHMNKSDEKRAEKVSSNKENIYLRTFTRELVVCASVLSLVAIYSFLYILRECEHDNEDTLSKRNRQLAKGWNFFKRKQDVADFEWFFWISEARDTLIGLILGHLVVSVLAHHLNLKIKSDCLFLYGFSAVFWLFGFIMIVWLTAICCLYYYVIKKGSLATVVCSTLGFLLALQHLPNAKYNFILTEMDYSILAKSGLTFAVFRCCSFVLETQRNRSGRRKFYDMMRYNFYIPYFFFGPVMTFDVFQDQNKHFLSRNVWVFVKEVLKTLLYVISVDILRHFLHVSSLPQDREFMINTPLIVIGFLAFVNFYLDWIKGRILYSVSSGIAKNIDGFVNAPECCKNVATIYTFADTYFDRGLQQFVCRYGYDSLSRTHEHFKQEAVAGAVSFAIVVAAQGITPQLCIWAFLNWFGLTSEFYLMNRFDGVLGERTRLLFLGVNYWLIVLFNCIAINGLEAFQMYFQKLFLNDGFAGLAQLIFVGYCYARLVHDFQSREMKTKSE